MENLSSYNSLSDVHKMEKEQEVERERDRARSTKFFDPKFSVNEPPPKVWIPVTFCSYMCQTIQVLNREDHLFIFPIAFKNETRAVWEHAQYWSAHSGTECSLGFL